MTTELRKSGLIRLVSRAGSTLTWVVPLWATLCGAIASGGLAFSIDAGVRLLLTMTLIELGWGTAWSALATTDWSTPLRRWRNWRMGQPTQLLPYTQEGTPGHRAARWLAQLSAWYQSVLAPAAGPALGAAVAGVALSLILSAVMGQAMVILTLAVLAAIELAVALDRGRGSPPVGWDALLRLGLPWVAGHLAFGAPTLPSVGLAAAYAVAVCGAGIVWQRRARGLWAIGQTLAAALFVVLGRPFTVLLLSLLLFPQWLIAIGAEAALSATPHRWVHRAWPWLMAAMLIAAGSL